MNDLETFTDDKPFTAREWDQLNVKREQNYRPTTREVLKMGILGILLFIGGFATLAAAMIFF